MSRTVLIVSILAAIFSLTAAAAIVWEYYRKRLADELKILNTPIPPAVATKGPKQDLGLFDPVTPRETMNLVQSDVSISQSLATPMSTPKQSSFSLRDDRKPAWTGGSSRFTV